MGGVIDMTGQRFGRLTVIRRSYVKSKRAYWLCQCDCGNQCVVCGVLLRRGDVMSCGCLRREKIGNLNLKWPEKNMRLYNIWRGAHQRCYSKNAPKYPVYGARGITVCDEWRTDFGAFQKWALENGYDETLTLDRIDVNGPYSPENCRWATPMVQSNNRRCNINLTYNGETHTVSEWSRLTGLSYGTILRRVCLRGWSVEKALMTPPMVARQRKLLTWNGETHNVEEWSRITGIKAATISGRINTGGWSVEKALSTPAQKRNSIKKKKN